MKSLLPLLVTLSGFTLSLAPALRAQTAGSLDAFDPNVAGNHVLAMIPQPDGKTVLAGGFSSVGGQARGNVARLNADGTLESTTTFNPGTGANNTVYGAALQTDGKIVISGAFTSVNGQTRNQIARLNADGSLETTATFNPGTGANTAVYCVRVQADGKILLAGAFTTVNGQPRNRIARLHADGTLEDTATFNPGTGANGTVFCVTQQPDGKILLAGEFTTVNGQARKGIARLHPDGSVEDLTTFNPGAGTNPRAFNAVVQADGKILISGDFISVDGQPRNGIARLNADGSIESTTTFNPGTGANGEVNSIVVQVDGRILLSGSFTTVNGQSRVRIARLHADGSVESTATFNAGTGANLTAFGLGLQPDGKIFVGGSLTTMNGTTRNHLARLANDPATQTLTAPGVTSLVWSRGGSAPEITRASFELSTDAGASWNLLGYGARIAGGWELTGLSLPLHGLVRARGTACGGYLNSSSGLVETMTPFTFEPEIVVEQPAGTNVPDGGGKTLTIPAGRNTSSVFTVRNTGTNDLTGLTLTIDGPGAADFSTPATPTAPVIGNGSTTFTLRFAPVTAGEKNAVLHITSNDSDENPFDIALTGQALSPAVDTDNDGINDVAEFQMSGLGFDWQTAQPGLVSMLFSNANEAGLFTTSQVQAMHMDAELAARDPATGEFLITIGLEKSTDLMNYVPFPMSLPQTTINPQGRLELRFTVPDNAAFFRLETD